MSIDNLIKDINKQFKVDIVQKGADLKDREFIPFSSPQLNYLTRGGICEGKMVELFGKEGSAKTTLALDILANYQKKYPERYALYLDAENTLDKDWGELLGVDWDKVLLIKPEEQSGEKLLDIVLASIQSGEVGLTVIDSVPFIVTQQAFENGLEKKTYGGNSALMSQFCQKAIPILGKNNCTCVCINQVREDLGSMFPSFKTPGGKALKHSYVQRLQLSKSKFLDELGNELTNSCETPAGHIAQAKLEKNKVTKNDRRLAPFTINYTIGIDVLRDTVDLAILLGVIHQSGAWFDYTKDGEQHKFQGKRKLIAHLTDNEEHRNYIISETNKEALK